MSAGNALSVGVDVTDRQVVLVGGGAQADRHAETLLRAGALVRVVSPLLHPRLRARLGVEPRLTWRSRAYAGSCDLADAWLVQTATGDAHVDEQVAADAEQARTFFLRPERASTRARGGRVALVGGGPGADGLLTVRGAQLLDAAEVVVVDRLAPRGLLAGLPSHVEVIDVGKDVGHHAVPQSEINAILVREAHAGRSVVRLKGGDPYVLGRGGEERLACEQAGVPVEVVPGITSAVSVPAAAGIPVTHRGVARSFTVVTGHDQLAAMPPGTDHTLVLLMGVARLRESTAALVAAGRSPQCPTAVIERGYLPGQRTTVAPLSDIADRCAEAGVTSPAVVVVGDVVRLGPDWSRSTSPTAVRVEHVLVAER